MSVPCQWEIENSQIFPPRLENDKASKMAEKQDFLDYRNMPEMSGKLLTTKMAL